MSLEIPTDVIREVQKQIREQSGLDGYDPDDSSLPSLPAVEDVIAELDPSPTYLRCKRCKGKFLSGVQSLFCVYCGADPEVPPEPMKFKSTFGYRWLLDALKLDGSEIVGQMREENEPNRDQASPKKELTVSELLDLEIRWPERPKKVAVRATGYQLTHDMSGVNLARMDLENFFPSVKSDAAGTLEKPGSTVQDVSEDVDLFENAASMKAAGQCNPNESGNDLSGWELHFQGADTVNSQNKEHPFDPFGVSSDNLSDQMESVFGSQKDSKVENSIVAATDTSPSANDWNEDAMWSNVSSGISEQPDKLEGRELEIQDGARKLDVSSNENDGWVLGDQWKTSTGKASDCVKVDGDDYSYDAWNDFTTSTSKPQNHFNVSSESMPLESHPTAMNLFSSNDLQDEDFGDFSELDLFSSSLHSRSLEMNHLQSEPTVSNRTYGVNIKAEEPDGNQKTLNEVETIMSQMHDLSFMLESNLSIPKTTADSGPFH